MVGGGASDADTILKMDSLVLVRLDGVVVGVTTICNESVERPIVVVCTFMRLYFALLLCVAEGSYFVAAAEED